MQSGYYVSVFSAMGFCTTSNSLSQELLRVFFCLYLTLVVIVTLWFLPVSKFDGRDHYSLLGSYLIIRADFFRDLQSYLSHLSLFMASDSGKFYILVDNRPWLKDLISRPTHLWQLMVTKVAQHLRPTLVSRVLELQF